MSRTPPSQEQTPKQVLRSVSYKAIKDFNDPILQDPLFKISKKDLCRLVYVLNGQLYKMNNDYDIAQKEIQRLLAPTPTELVDK